MIIGIGSDLIDIRRIEKSIEKFGEKFTARCFTQEEQARSNGRKDCAASYAKRFAAKEAFVKALGTGFRGVGYKDAGVVHLPSGKPTLAFSPAMRERLNALGIAGGQVSLTGNVNVVTDGSGARPVRLIFRDHPEWGRSSYLVLESGDFDCYGGCRLKVAVDDGVAKSMAGSRPKTDEAIAMFIEDERALWRQAKSAERTLSIEVPVEGAGKHTVVFEVGGLDAAQMPGWN